MVGILLFSAAYILGSFSLDLPLPSALGTEVLPLSAAQAVSRGYLADLLWEWELL